VLKLTSEHDNRLGLVVRTICLDREPFRDALSALTLPAIRALNLAYPNSAYRIPKTPDTLPRTDQPRSPSSIKAINLHRGKARLELCGELIQLVEHMFDYKTGVRHLRIKTAKTPNRTWQSEDDT
jgi:hypothetical protein